MVDGERPAVDERQRLHEMVDALPDDEVSVAVHLLELLAKGRAGLPGVDLAADTDGDEDDDLEDDDDEVGSPAPAPETIAKLAQLTDEELLRLDELLETDPAAARTFWRERFGEELEDESLTGR